MIIRLIKYIQSFITGIYLEKTSSNVNPYLEVVYINGKVMLNSTTANYSQGELYDSFEQEFETLNFKNKSFDTALILGFGVGSVASLLLEKYKMNCSITGVEIDSKVIELGYKYFNLHRFKNVELFCDDAFLFVQENTRKYDLIVVDVYIDNMVPENCETKEFLQWLKYSLCNTGIIVFNKFIDNERNKNTATSLEKSFKAVFDKFEIHEIKKSETNKMFVVENNQGYV